MNASPALGDQSLKMQYPPRMTLKHLSRQKARGMVGSSLRRTPTFSFVGIIGVREGPLVNGRSESLRNHIARSNIFTDNMV